VQTATRPSSSTGAAPSSSTGTAPSASGEPRLAPLPAGAFDASYAHVEWNVTAAGGGATAAAAQRPLSARAGRWNECYRSHLERRGERIAGQAVMRLTTDGAGNVVGARISGFDVMPAVKQCIGAASRVHVDGVENADAWVDVHLVFLPE
jgi:hypothetical protein